MSSESFQVGDQVRLRSSSAVAVIDTANYDTMYPYLVRHNDGTQEGCRADELELVVAAWPGRGSGGLEAFSLQERSNVEDNFRWTAQGVAMLKEKGAWEVYGSPEADDIVDMDVVEARGKRDDLEKWVRVGIVTQANLGTGMSGFHPEDEESAFASEVVVGHVQVPDPVAQLPLEACGCGELLVDGSCSKCEQLKRLWRQTPTWNGWVGYSEQSAAGLSAWERNRRANLAPRGLTTSTVPERNRREDPLPRASAASSSSSAAAGSCGICLNDGLQLVKFSDQCCHRFCRPCLNRCAAWHHDVCPMCRAPKAAPIAEETEVGPSGRFEARMLLGLVGRHAGLDHFG